MLRDQILVQVPGIVLDCGQTSGLVWSVSGPRSSYSESSKNEYFVHSRTVTLFYIQALHIVVVFFHRGSVNSSLIINDKGCLYSCPTLTWIPVLKWGPPTWLWLLSAPQSCYVLLRVLFYHTYTNTGTTHSEWERHTTVHSLQKAGWLDKLILHDRETWALLHFTAKTRWCKNQRNLNAVKRILNTSCSLLIYSALAAGRQSVFLDITEH